MCQWTNDASCSTILKQHAAANAKFVKDQKTRKALLQDRINLITQLNSENDELASAEQSVTSFIHGLKHGKGELDALIEIVDVYNNII